MALSLSISIQAAELPNLSALVGKPVDIASSAYQYRADRKPTDNPPESWLAVMRFAGQALNKPADTNAPKVKQVVSAFLWEEIRPVQQVEVIWSNDAARRPGTEQLVVTTLDHQGPASSWWNNLKAVQKPVKPTVSGDGRVWAYTLAIPTCGLVFSINGAKIAADYEVPKVRVLVADVWKQMDVEIEWGFDEATAAKDYSGRIETYDGLVAGLAPLVGDTVTTTAGPDSWKSSVKSGSRRGVKASLAYMGIAKWRKTMDFTSQQEDVARTIVTVWTKSGNFSFLAADLENGPILAPEYGFFVRRTLELTAPVKPWEGPISLASKATNAQEFLKELQTRKLSTIRQQTRARDEQTWEGAVTGMHGTNLPPIPKAPAGSEPTMKVEVPSEQLTAQWNLGAWHLLRRCEKHPSNGRLWFNDAPYGILACETYLILSALDQMGSHKAAEDGFDQWVSLPIDQKVAVKKGRRDPNGVHHQGSLPDRPVGLFTDGSGSMTLAVGPKGSGGNMDGVHAFGPGSTGWALVEHYRITGDKEWFKASAPRIKANVEWMLRQRRTVQDMVPGGDRLWCKGLQPAMQMTPDAGGLFLQFYGHEAYYWVSVAHFAKALVTIDPEGGAKLMAEAEAYRKDLMTAVERTIALSPVVPVRDGMYHSVIPFATYMRGMGTGAWGWKRDGSGGHWGPLSFETDMSAVALLSPAQLLSPDDVRVQG